MTFHTLERLLASFVLCTGMQLFAALQLDSDIRFRRLMSDVAPSAVSAFLLASGDRGITLDEKLSIDFRRRRILARSRGR